MIDEHALRIEYDEEQLGEAAVQGALFLRTLPDGVDSYKVLKGLEHVLGGELCSRIMLEILNPSMGEQLYIGVEDPTGRNQKINAIKEVRGLTRAGLKEAKDFVEGAHPLKMTPKTAIALEREIRGFGFAVKRYYL